MSHLSLSYLHCTIHWSICQHIVRMVLTIVQYSDILYPVTVQTIERFERI
jgi:hypothetical protein